MSLSRCPVTHEFEPFSAAYLNNPSKLQSHLREASPVCYDPELNVYLVTRFEDIEKILQDRDTFSAANATRFPIKPLEAEAKAILDKGFPIKPTFSNSDPPRHPRMRHSSSLCLTMRRWASMEPMLAEFISESIDRILEKPVSDLGADLVFPLTAFAGLGLIGFPREDFDKIRYWNAKRVVINNTLISNEEQVEAARNLVDFWNYTTAFVAKRRENPTDDLTSDLLRLVDKGVDSIDDEDVANMIYAISLASYETSAAGILHGIKHLLTHLDDWEELCADPSLIPNATEELLRLYPSVITHRRLAKVDTEIGGVAIPAGAHIMMLFGAGNHDPSHFPDPDVYNPRRENAPDHLAFGRFWHQCLGAPLARMEYRLTLEALTKRCSRMRLVPDQVTKHAPIIHLHVPDKLLVIPDSTRGMGDAGRSGMAAE